MYPSFPLPAEQTDHTFFLCSGTAAPQQWRVVLYCREQACLFPTSCLRRKRPGDSAACPTHIKKAWSLCARNPFQKNRILETSLHPHPDKQASAGGELCRSEALIWRAATVSRATARDERAKSGVRRHGGASNGRTQTMRARPRRSLGYPWRESEKYEVGLLLAEGEALPKLGRPVHTVI